VQRLCAVYESAEVGECSVVWYHVISGVPVFLHMRHCMLMLLLLLRERVVALCCAGQSWWRVIHPPYFLTPVTLSDVFE
jgi:hypothetical protein